MLSKIYLEASFEVDFQFYLLLWAFFGLNFGVTLRSDFWSIQVYFQRFFRLTCVEFRKKCVGELKNWFGTSV